MVTTGTTGTSGFTTGFSTRGINFSTSGFWYTIMYQWLKKPTEYTESKPTVLMGEPEVAFL